MADRVSCPVCSERVESRTLFCPRCTAPLSVVSLGSLTREDHALCLKALAQVVSELTLAEDQPDRPADTELWNAYLSALWLRPETALIQYAEALGLEEISRRNLLPGGEWCDLGCGDGVHSALYSGWRFDAKFDCFQSLDLSQRDMFDAFDPSRFAVRFTRPGRTIAWGIDIKPTAILRSQALKGSEGSVFRDVVRADASALPLQSDAVSVVFSNMIRDLGQTLPAALAEVRRVLVPGGALVVSAMTPAYRQNLHFEPAARAASARGEEALARQFLKLDRGRSVFCRQQLTPEQWRSLLHDAGLELTAVQPIIGGQAIRFWDVGLRPFSAGIIAQVDAWRSKGILAEVKPALLGVLATGMENLRRQLLQGESCMQLLVARKP